MQFSRIHRAISAVAAALLLLAGLTSMVSAVAPATPEFERTWARTDKPVADDVIDRTWMWGPEANTDLKEEPYAESPEGMRVVQYFDKSRMEITHPDAVDDGLWYVTNGLLVVELITGQIQVGDDEFIPHHPAEIGVAGDPDDVNGPTYATFANLLGPVDDRGSVVIADTVNRSGEVGVDAAYIERGVLTAYWDEVTQHNIAAPFWEFMTSTGTVYENGQFVDAQLFLTPVYATGRPITEPYWAQVKVNGSILSVLMQCFERRCLTYTPDNPAGWQVEAGNVGLHYYGWRYGDGGPTDPRVIVTDIGIVVDGAVEQPDNLIAGQPVTVGAQIENQTDADVLAEVTTTVECTNLEPVTVNQQQIVVPALGAALYQTAWTPPGAEGTCTFTVTVAVDGEVIDTATWTITISDDAGGSPTATATSTSTSTATSTATSTGTATATGTSTSTATSTATSTSTSTSTATSTGTSTSTATSTSTSTATSTSTTTPTNPSINIESFGIVVGAAIQVPDTLTAGTAVSLGARIQNNANVAETVNVVTTYTCPVGGMTTINQQQITIPANGNALYQINWTPPGLDLLCTLEITATTVRTPVDSDSEDWLVLLSAGVGGSPTATATSTATSTATQTVVPTNPDINVQAFGVVVGSALVQLGELPVGTAVGLGARIQNNANVSEVVNVRTTYQCVVGVNMTINEQQITISANSVASYTTSWTPSGVGLLCDVTITATTVRTPVDTDTEDWAVLLTLGLGLLDAPVDRLTNY